MTTELQILKPHVKDLGGGFLVRRLLPAAARQAVGPFVFFDHFGPIEAGPHENHDVRPHPHIGLSTVTYLFEGAMMHRDSTGVVQRIEPGALNWMTAGRGIVHSERTPDDLRGVTRRSHGLQLWVAVPAEAEEGEPGFSHTAAADIPEFSADGARVRVLVGSAYGVNSPVPAVSPTAYLDITLAAGGTLVLPPVATERALYGVEGGYSVDGVPVEPFTLAVLPQGATVTISSPDGARLAMVGGDPLGHRYLWWNFVSSSRERLKQAADDWAAGRFPPVPGETEFIPLPEKRPT